MKLFRLILSWLYAAGVWLRNLLYDEHILYVHHPHVPTICVGNLAVGGTGKTPHVEYIVRLLTSNGYRVAILSRGYKRRTTGFVLANQNTFANYIGDEPRQMYLRFPEVPLAVCEDRYRGIRRLQKLYPDLDAIVLDDAFQHRSVQCGYNILLTPADNLYVNDHLLPYGRLREPARGYVRADIIVVSKCPESMSPIERRIVATRLHPAPYQDLAFSSIVASAPLPLYPEDAAKPAVDGNAEVAVMQPLSLETAGPKSIFLLAGIAQPQYMRASLGDRLAGELIFPDHHAFVPQDIAAIAEAFLKSGARYILTTEKDAVRLRDSLLVTDDLRPKIFYQTVSVAFEADSVFDNKVLRYVSEQRHKRLKDQGKV